MKTQHYDTHETALGQAAYYNIKLGFSLYAIVTSELPSIPIKVFFYRLLSAAVYRFTATMECAQESNVHQW